jgi:hypothetical protein
MSFKQFLAEESQKGQVLHPEDAILHNGEQGFRGALNALVGVHEKLSGKFNTTKIKERFKGNGNIVFGHHPKNGKFFVATTDSKDQSIPLFSEKDIDDIVDDPALAEKLKLAFKHLQRVAPEKGIYASDIMHTSGDRLEFEKKHHFFVGGTKYAVPSKSDEGKKVADSKLGIVVHGKYSNPALPGSKLSPDPDLHNFKENKAVHIMNREIDSDSILHGSDSSVPVEHHLKQAEKTLENSHPDMLETLASHNQTLKSYLNRMAKEGQAPSTAGYRRFLMDSGTDTAEKETGARGKQEAHNNMVQSLKGAEDNDEHLENLFKIHNHMQKAKDLLIKSLDSSDPYERTKDGEQIPPLGYDVIHQGQTIKLENRKKKAPK